MEGEDSTEHKANQILIFNQSGMNDMMDDRTSSWLEFCVVITGGELPHFMNFMNIAAVKFPSQPRIRPLSSALWSRLECGSAQFCTESDGRPGRKRLYEYKRGEVARPAMALGDPQGTSD